MLSGRVIRIVSIPFLGVADMMGGIAIGDTGNMIMVLMIALQGIKDTDKVLDIIMMARPIIKDDGMVILGFGAEEEIDRAIKNLSK